VARTTATPEPGTPQVDLTAIPLAPGQMRLLVNALAEADTLAAVHHWTGTPGCHRSLAAAVLQTAGMAAASGHPVIPVLATSIHSYELAHADLLRHAPRDGLTAEFGELVQQMHLLWGMARVKRWQAQVTAAGLQWRGDPPQMKEEAGCLVPAGPHGQSPAPQ
jgi:hypothetical protein